MNIPNFLKFKKDFFNSKNISRFCSDFWDRYFKLLFLLFSLLILSLGISFWFQITYQSDWDSEQKKQYQNSQNKEIEFKERQFKEIAGMLERKKENYNSIVRESKDIFASYLVEDQAKEEKSSTENSSSNSDTSTNNSSNNRERSFP